MKQYTFLGSFFFFFLMTFLTVSADITEMRTIKQAGEKDFPRFIQAALKNKADYGFKEDDTLDRITLADPICVWNLNKEVLQNMSDVSFLNQAFEPINECLLPVMVDGEYRTLFAVRKKGEMWKGSYLGNPLLAKKLQDLRRIWSKENNDFFKLVSCVHPRSFWYVLINETRPNLTPLTDVSLNGKNILAVKDFSSWMPFEEIIRDLKDFWLSQENEFK